MTRYRREPEVVQAALMQTPGSQVLTKKACRIQIPTRFTEKAVGLGQVGVDTFIYGMYALILETGEYAVCNLCGLMQINPYKQALVTVDEVEYHEFYFEPNQVLIKSCDIVKRDELIYNILDEVVFEGKVPWYVEYEDLGKLFATAQVHAGSNVGATPEVIEFIVSMMGRSSKDRTKHIREIAKSFADYGNDNVEFVPLKSVFYAVNNTVSKIAGSYFSEGVVSALVNPSEKVSKVEKLLRA